MDITVSQKDDLMIIAVEGRLDISGANELDEWISDDFEAPECPVTMDFTQLDYISSAGLRVLLNISKIMKKKSSPFSICNAQDHVREVLEISGFDSFIPLFNSTEDCLR